VSALTVKNTAARGRRIRTQDLRNGPNSDWSNRGPQNDAQTSPIGQDVLHERLHLIHENNNIINSVQTLR
jgi:hypothetical protein